MEHQYFYHNISPRRIYLYSVAYSDPECSEIIGRKFNDIGTEQTAFYTEDYKGKFNIRADATIPGLVIRNVADGVWIKIPISQNEEDVINVYNLKNWSLYFW